MNPALYLVIMVVALVVVVGLAVSTALVRRKAQLDDPRHPRGYYIGMGLALGLVAGAALAALLDALTDRANSFLSIGPAMGMPLGLAVGAALEKRHKDELRPLSAQEARLKQVSAWVMLAAAAVVLIGMVALLLLR